MKKRFEWLAEVINRNNLTKGVEIGVGRGKTSLHLLAYCPHLFLICIDPWKPIHKDIEPPQGKTLDYAESWDHEGYYKRFIARTAKYVQQNRLKIRRCLSTNTQLLNSIPDATLGFVFIDGDHSYEGCKADILNWSPKIKAGGLLCGHDIDWPGVNSAVKELVPDYQEAENAVWFKWLQSS